MAPADKHATPAGDDYEQYTTCKGILAYVGKQRAEGLEPHCLGFKAHLPPNIDIIDEDIVPPPPEDTRFTFLGIGVSVYSKEMLAKNRLPLVNGFSRLTVLKREEQEQQQGEAVPQQQQEQREESKKLSGGTKEMGVNGHPDAQGQAQGQRKPRQHTVDAPPGVVGGAHRGRQQQQQQQQGSAVPATLSERRSGGGGGGEERPAGGTRDQMEALVDYAVGRVKKQVEMTKQVAEELTKLTPGKLREAAVVQANKVQEMPTLLLDTSKRMVGSGAKFVQNYIDEQDRKK